MTPTAFTLFNTAIGRCGIAWGELGLVGVQLPEESEGRTLARMRRRFPDAGEGTPPGDVQQTIDGVGALLRGETADFSAVLLDLEAVPLFDRGVYEIARAIPPGATLTYGEIAARLGKPSAARQVGQALGRNPFPLVVPCHRVLAAGGRTGGFSAPGGTATKLRLLAIEGAQANAIPTLFE